MLIDWYHDIRYLIGTLLLEKSCPKRMGPTLYHTLKGHLTYVQKKLLRQTKTKPKEKEKRKKLKEKKG